jgi:hypothetical protein
MKEGRQTAKVLAPLIGSMEVRGSPANRSMSVSVT